MRIDSCQMHGHVSQDLPCARKPIRTISEFVELISRLEFDFRRCENYLNDSNFWCVQSSITHNAAVHVPVMFVYIHTFKMYVRTTQKKQWRVIPCVAGSKWLRVFFWKKNGLRANADALIDKQLRSWTAGRRREYCIRLPINVSRSPLPCSLVWTKMLCDVVSSATLSLSMGVIFSVWFCNWELLVLQTDRTFSSIVILISAGVMFQCVLWAKLVCSSFEGMVGIPWGTRPPQLKWCR